MATATIEIAAVVTRGLLPGVALLLALPLAAGAATADPDAARQAPTVAGIAASRLSDFAGPDLQITLTDGVTTATPGGSVVYTIIAGNGGADSINNATVTDLFPSTLTCVWTCTTTGGGTCTPSGSGNISDTVGIPVEARLTYTATCSISPAATGMLTNTATITPPSGISDPNPANNMATDTDTLTAPHGAHLFTITPCRLIDTRNADGPHGGPPLAAQSARTFAVAGQCGLPTSATSVSYNVTVAQPTAAGGLRIYPTGIPQPMTSVLSYQSGATRANNGTVDLGPNGAVVVWSDQPTGTAQLILDINGYFE
jgi:uncharacterized repeat protein (TIGR01451 family)